MLITPDTNVPYTVKCSAAQRTSGVICEHIKTEVRTRLKGPCMLKENKGRIKHCCFTVKTENFPGQTCSNSLAILHWNDPLKIIKKKLGIAKHFSVILYQWLLR